LDFLENKNVIIVVTTTILAYVNPLCKVQAEEPVLYTRGQIYPKKPSKSKRSAPLHFISQVDRFKTSEKNYFSNYSQER
jgi:hypothetical protein